MCSICFRVEVKYKCGDITDGSSVRFSAKKTKALRIIKYITAKEITNRKLALKECIISSMTE